MDPQISVAMKRLRHEPRPYINLEQRICGITVRSAATMSYMIRRQMLAPMSLGLAIEPFENVDCGLSQGNDGGEDDNKNVNQS